MVSIPPPLATNSSRVNKVDFAKQHYIGRNFFPVKTTKTVFSNNIRILGLLTLHYYYHYDFIAHRTKKSLIRLLVKVKFEGASNISVNFICLLTNEMRCYKLLDDNWCFIGSTPSADDCKKAQQIPPSSPTVVATVDKRIIIISLES